MTVSPSFPEFKRLAERYNVIPLMREMVIDRETPVSVYERLRRRESHSFLLESVEGGEHIGRYSFVGQRPHATFVCQDGTVTYQEGKVRKSWKAANPVDDLKALFRNFKAAPVEGLPRFAGGAVGYWDYDTVRYFERLPTENADRLGFPQGAFQLSGEMVVFDRFSHTAQVLANVFVPPGKLTDRVLQALYRNGIASLERQIKVIENPRFVSARVRKQGKPKAVSLTSRQGYLQAVERGKEYIRAGDIIQVVLSQRWALEKTSSPYQIYRALRLINPSPYMYCLHFPDLDIVGSSPEMLVRKEGLQAETRPIAGTRPRGKTPEEDQRLADELLRDAKERAEHLMLVDLGRNDLGRVSRSGSVHVPDLMTVERYSHVMHIVSSVTGTLRSDATMFDLFQACFPAGTLTGAPKIRAMQIIDELEKTRRGPYGGAIGYFAYNGNMDMAITIRTLILRKGKAYLQAGAGIVADSVPEKEYQECRNKAAALISAVEKASELS